MLRGEVTTGASTGNDPILQRRASDPRRGSLMLLSAVTGGLSGAREPRIARERFEQTLRSLSRAESVILREDGGGKRQALCYDVPAFGPELRPRLEVTFESGRRPDDWTCQLFEMAAHVAALLIEIERAQGRYTLASRFRPDGAAPLIGSSRAIRALRQRIERVAATDFTVLVEGAIDPQAHPSFVEVFSEAAMHDRHGKVEGAGEGAAAITVICPPRSRSPRTIELARGWPRFEQHLTERLETPGDLSGPIILSRRQKPPVPDPARARWSL
jgi:hypothetical protein